MTDLLKTHAMIPAWQSPLGTNDLKIYRRHVAACTRYPGLKKKPDTFRPNSKKEQMEDTCKCPIWCRGYLAKETETVADHIRPKRVFGSLGCHTWTPAQKEVARLYERGSFPAVSSGAKALLAPSRGGGISR